MSKLLDQFNAEQERKIPAVRTGDTVKIHQKIKEGTKERIQIFEGIIIAKKHGKGISATMTVRKVVDSVGVERIFPLHSTSIEKIEVVKSGKTRRSKLYFLRTAKGKKAKLKKRDFAVAIADEPVAVTAEVAEPVKEELPAPEAPATEVKPEESK